MKCLAERKNNPQNDLLCVILLFSFCPDVSIYGVWKRDGGRPPGDQMPATVGRGFLHIMVVTGMQHFLRPPGRSRGVKGQIIAL